MLSNLINQWNVNNFFLKFESNINIDIFDCGLQFKENIGWNRFQARWNYSHYSSPFFWQTLHSALQQKEKLSQNLVLNLLCVQSSAMAVDTVVTLVQMEIVTVANQERKKSRFVLNLIRIFAKSVICGNFFFIFIWKAEADEVYPRSCTDETCKNLCYGRGFRSYACVKGRCQCGDSGMLKEKESTFYEFFIQKTVIRSLFYFNRQDSPWTMHYRNLSEKLH